MRQFNGLILQMGKERPYIADSFVMCKPPPCGGLGCHPVSQATTQRSCLSHWPKCPGAETAGEAECIPAACRDAAGEKSRPWARPRLSAQVCQQWQWREGAAANFRAERRGKGWRAA